MEVDIGVARFEWIEGPGDELVAAPERIGTLGLFQADPDARASVLGQNRELVRAQPELAVAPAEEGKAEAHQAAVRSKRAMHQPTVQLYRQQQLAGHDVALGCSPDVAAHRLAGRVLPLRLDEPNLDTREIPRP